MDERIRAYARLRLDRAREDLETARENIASDRFRAAINRSYYAMFHIASAALLTQAVKRSKHSGVQAAFAEFLVKPGRIEPEFSRLYRRSRSQREAADYQDEFVADEATARQALADAERFVERVERFLREVGAL